VKVWERKEDPDHGTQIVGCERRYPAACRCTQLVEN